MKTNKMVISVTDTGKRKIMQNNKEDGIKLEKKSLVKLVSYIGGDCRFIETARAMSVARWSYSSSSLVSVRHRKRKRVVLNGCYCSYCCLDWLVRFCY